MSRPKIEVFFYVSLTTELWGVGCPLAKKHGLNCIVVHKKGTKCSVE